MTNPLYDEVLSKLAEKTDAGQANWQSTSDKSEFIVYLADYSVSVRKWWDDGDDTWNVTITFRDREGKVIDTSTLTSGVDEDYDLASHVHEAARRKALNIDDVLSKVLAELSKEGPVGKSTPPDEGVPF